MRVTSSVCVLISPTNSSLCSVSVKCVNDYSYTTPHAHYARYLYNVLFNFYNHIPAAFTQKANKDARKILSNNHCTHWTETAVLSWSRNSQYPSMPWSGRLQCTYIYAYINRWFIITMFLADWRGRSCFSTTHDLQQHAPAEVLTLTLFKRLSWIASSWSVSVPCLV